MTKSQATFDRMLREAFRPQPILIANICRICKHTIGHNLLPGERVGGWVCDDCREDLR